MSVSQERLEPAAKLLEFSLQPNNLNGVSPDRFGQHVDPGTDEMALAPRVDLRLKVQALQTQLPVEYGRQLLVVRDHPGSQLALKIRERRYLRRRQWGWMETGGLWRRDHLRRVDQAREVT
jgi:hypothetical protein